MEKLTEAQVVSFLVKMADDLDREGNHALASEVDGTLKSFSARPKAPLKQLDDDVKKNLIIFVHDADRGTGKSIKGLKELFRRLRYFDLADSVKDLGLDKTVKEMEKTQGCLCDAKKKLYEMMMGKKPSSQALDDFLGSAADDGANEQSALDFFDSQSSDDTMYDDEANDCPDPGKKRRSGGEGKGLGFGEGKGPIKIPIDEKLDEDEIDELDEDEEDLTEELEEELRSFLEGLDEEDLEDEGDEG